MILVPGILALGPFEAHGWDADQPGKTNDLDGVVWHFDASDNSSFHVWCFERWCTLEAQVSNFTLFFPRFKNSKTTFVQKLPVTVVKVSFLALPTPPLPVLDTGI